VLAAFKKAHNMMKNVLSHSIKRLHTDNGSEHDNDLMFSYLEDKGLERTTTAPYQPQSNGIAERVIIPLWERFEPCYYVAILVTNSGLMQCCMLHIYAIEHYHQPQEVLLHTSAYMHLCRLWETYAFSDVSPMQKYTEKRNKLFEKSIRTALLECLPGMQYIVLTWIMLTFTTYDMSNLTSIISPPMDQEQENSSLKKKRITT
jgi:transposase InsO family protein